MLAARPIKCPKVGGASYAIDDNPALALKFGYVPSSSPSLPSSFVASFPVLKGLFFLGIVIWGLDRDTPLPPSLPPSLPPFLPRSYEDFLLKLTPDRKAISKLGLAYAKLPGGATSLFAPSEGKTAEIVDLKVYARQGR